MMAWTWGGITGLNRVKLWEGAGKETNDSFNFISRAMPGGQLLDYKEKAT